MSGVEQTGEAAVPDTYDTYAETATDPRFTNWLRERAGTAWTDATEHPFTEDLGAGTLEEDAYAHYLVQDYAFFTDLIGTFSLAVAQAPTMASKRPLIEFLEVVTDDEDDYFQRSFDALAVPESTWADPELNDAAAAFVDLLGRAAYEGEYAESLAVLVPAEWIYASWATRVVDEHADPDTQPPSDGADLPFYYAEWIDLHATDAFCEFVDWLRGELDTVGPQLSPRRQRRVEQFFTRTVTLEGAFFDAAYNST